MKYRVTIGDRVFEIELDNERLVRVNGHSLYVDLEQVGGLPVYSLAVGNEGHVVFVEPGQGEYRVETQGQVFQVHVHNGRPVLAPRQVDCGTDGEECLNVSAPLAGRLVDIPVSVGDRVSAGQAVAIVESMKMSMRLRAPQSAVVEAVHGPPGRNLEQDEVLVVLRRE